MLTWECTETFRNNWPIVPGATPEEQWPAEFPPIQGWSVVPDDSQAVVRSPVGSRYKFVQPISIYGAAETATFRVRANTKDGSYQRLRTFLDPIGTHGNIKMNFPGSDTTKWLQKQPPQYVHQGGQKYEVSLVLEQDHNPG